MLNLIFYEWQTAQASPVQPQKNPTTIVFTHLQGRYFDFQFHHFLAVANRDREIVEFLAWETPDFMLVLSKS